MTVMINRWKWTTVTLVVAVQQMLMNLAISCYYHLVIAADLYALTYCRFIFVLFMLRLSPFSCVKKKCEFINILYSF